MDLQRQQQHRRRRRRQQHQRRRRRRREEGRATGGEEGEGKKGRCWRLIASQAVDVACLPKEERTHACLPFAADSLSRSAESKREGDVAGHYFSTSEIVFSLPPSRLASHPPPPSLHSSAPSLPRSRDSKSCLFRSTRETEGEKEPLSRCSSLVLALREHHPLSASGDASRGRQVTRAHVYTSCKSTGTRRHAFASETRQSGRRRREARDVSFPILQSSCAWKIMSQILLPLLLLLLTRGRERDDVF